MKKKAIVAKRVEPLESRPPETHPTCRAVLKLLNEATQLIRERIGEGTATPEIQAMAIGYCFSAMRDRSGPFSHIDVRTLVQEAFSEGWKQCEEYRRIRNGNADYLRP